MRRGRITPAGAAVLNAVTGGTPLSPRQLADLHRSGHPEPLQPRGPNESAEVGEEYWRRERERRQAQRRG